MELKLGFVTGLFPELFRHQSRPLTPGWFGFCRHGCSEREPGLRRPDQRLRGLHGGPEPGLLRHPAVRRRRPAQPLQPEPAGPAERVGSRQPEGRWDAPPFTTSSAPVPAEGSGAGNTTDAEEQTKQSAVRGGDRGGSDSKQADMMRVNQSAEQVAQQVNG